ncbi:hypothetical protein ONZ45_g14421 [Pleurotus djamor]|nr:hypothetical protein ONZ45_g14421 [Pleurotus djamor]
MVFIPTLPLVKGLVSIPHSIALIVTLFRLFDRWRLRRLWWDDWWALTALICNMVNWLALLLRPPNGSGERYFPIESRVGIFWLSLLFFPLTLWTARISIGVSLVRVLPPGNIMRKVAFFMNILFGFMCMGILVQRIYSCARTDAWHNSATVQCTFPSGAGVNNLVTDVVADVILIAVPLIALWKVYMPLNLRRIIYSIFTASILITIFSVIYATFLFVSRPRASLRIYVTVMSHVECAVALIVCDLFVLVAFCYRKFGQGIDIEVDDASSTAFLPSRAAQNTKTVAASDSEKGDSCEKLGV